MTEEDVLRYIEFEAPGMGIVQNEASEVVCLLDRCDERVTVGPSTLVAEDDEAVSVTARVAGTSNTFNVEIYCCPGHRNEQYSGPVPDDFDYKTVEDVE